MARENNICTAHRICRTHRRSIGRRLIHVGVPPFVSCLFDYQQPTKLRHCDLNSRHCLFIRLSEHLPPAGTQVADAICLFFCDSKQKITPVPIINAHKCSTRAPTNFIITYVRAASDFWTKETDIGVRRRGMPERLVTQTGLAKYYRAEKMSHHGLAGCCPRDGALRHFSVWRSASWASAGLAP